MSKITFIGGDLIEKIGGANRIYAKEGYEISSGKEIIFNAKEGIIYGEPEFPPMTEQPIKVIVQFRPHKDWKGEFGFDWFKMGDTMLFHDIAFKDVVAYQYSDYQFTKIVDDSNPKNVNKNNGYFKTNKEMLNELKNLYKPFTIPWKTTKNAKTGKTTAEEYFIPWMSLLKDKEAKITFFAEIKEEADYLEFPASDYFTFTPNKITIKGKKKISLNDFDITIQCIKEFENDQTIELKAYKKNAKGETIEAVIGKINVWANDASKLKEKDVVFVEIRTPEINGKKSKPNVDNEKEIINQYLGQAYTKLSDLSDIIELNLSSDKDFLNFINGSSIDNSKTSLFRDLEDYLKMKLEESYPKKYTSHFKAFYFDEKGYGGPSSNLNGYSRPGDDFVVVFNTKDDQTVSHEFLHSMGLAHTFTNKQTDKKALFTYDFQRTDNLMDYVEPTEKNKRTSLYYWQWKIVNESIK